MSHFTILSLHLKANDSIHKYFQSNHVNQTEMKGKVFEKYKIVSKLKHFLTIESSYATVGRGFSLLPECSRK